MSILRVELTVGPTGKTASLPQLNPQPRYAGRARKRMALPELTKKLVESRLIHYCDKKIPPQFRDEIKLGFKFRGDSVTLFEERPSFMKSDKWVTIVVAQFRFDPRTSLWTLYYADRNSRWHQYWDIEPGKNLDDLIGEVDRDPTGIFWG